MSLWFFMLHNHAESCHVSRTVTEPCDQHGRFCLFLSVGSKGISQYSNGFFQPAGMQMLMGGIRVTGFCAMHIACAACFFPLAGH